MQAPGDAARADHEAGAGADAQAAPRHAPRLTVAVATCPYSARHDRAPVLAPRAVRLHHHLWCKDGTNVAPNSTPTADAAPVRTATISITFVRRPMKRSVTAPAATVDQKADAPWDGSHGSSAYW